MVVGEGIMKRLIILALLILPTLAAGQVAFYQRRSMSAAPPADTVNLLSGIVAYWKLDEASGQRNDSVAATHLSEVGGTVTGVAGKISNAANFDLAQARYLTVASNSVVQTGNIEFSFFGWFNLGTAVDGSGQRAIFGKSDEYFFKCGDMAYCVWVNTHTDFNIYPTPVTRSAWHSFYVAYSAANKTTYMQIDNGTVNTQTVTTPIVVTSQAFDIGIIYEAPLQAFDGPVDELGMWKRLLNPTERTTLYNSGNGKTYPF